MKSAFHPQVTDAEDIHYELHSNGTKHAKGGMMLGCTKSCNLGITGATIVPAKCHESRSVSSIIILPLRQ